MAYQTQPLPPHSFYHEPQTAANLTQKPFVMKPSKPKKERREKEKRQKNSEKPTSISTIFSGPPQDLLQIKNSHAESSENSLRVKIFVPLGFPQYSIYYLLDIHRNVTAQELKAQLLTQLKLATSGRYLGYKISMMKLGTS